MNPTPLLSNITEETALLIGVQWGRETGRAVAESLDELMLLCKTAGAKVADQVICRMAKPHPATFIGKGKTMEMADKVKALQVNMVVFDDELSPAQGRNLETIMGVKVIDRAQLILDIFAQRAKSREGQMQIELAQLEYLLPRLKRMWTHLERQKGGIGLRGPGEQQIEMDRRRILDRITRYRRDLEHVRNHRAEQRRGRRRHGWALVSLVGYTNAGKSTLLNALTGAQVLADDKLFATLDPTTRQLKLPNNQFALLTDTVGFIRKLPHHLVESFKATLEEVMEADILLHVIDSSHVNVEEQIDAVHGVLKELDAHEKPVIAVFNKMDQEGAHQRFVRLSGRYKHHAAISALTGEGLDHLREIIADCLRNRNVRLRLRVPLQEGKLLATLNHIGTILSKEYGDGYVALEVYIPANQQGLFNKYVITDENASDNNRIPDQQVEN